MKTMRRAIYILVTLFALAVVFSSCTKKACPAYSSIQTHQIEANA